MKLCYETMHWERVLHPANQNYEDDVSSLETLPWNYHWDWPNILYMSFVQNLFLQLPFVRLQLLSLLNGGNIYIDGLTFLL